MDTMLQLFDVRILALLGTCVSVIAAICLSNHRPTEGRVIASMAATVWGFYAALTEQWALLVTDVVYIVIYAQAYFKFKRKRDGYRIKFNSLENANEHLESENIRLKKKLLGLKRSVEKLDLD